MGDLAKVDPKRHRAKEACVGPAFQALKNRDAILDIVGPDKLHLRQENRGGFHPAATLAQRHVGLSIQPQIAFEKTDFLFTRSQMENQDTPSIPLLCLTVFKLVIGW